MRRSIEVGQSKDALSGFDAVEIHLGHNYLASSFLSPLINRRTDEFGGSLANRAKVARGLVLAVRRAVDQGPRQIAVTAKLNMSDGVRGGIPSPLTVRCVMGGERPALPGPVRPAGREPALIQ